MEWRFEMTIADSDPENIFESKHASRSEQWPNAKEQFLISGLVWSDNMRYHNSLQEDIILGTKPGQEYIFPVRRYNLVYGQTRFMSIFRHSVEMPPIKFRKRLTNFMIFISLFEKFCYQTLL